MKLQRKDFTATPTTESYNQMIEDLLAFTEQEKIDPLDSIIIPVTLNAGFEVRITVLWPRPDAVKS